jgi:RNA polymerase sigma-70 factor (ECF subfamily)
MIASEARGAWSELEARLRPYVARRVPPPEVDDVLQEIFVRMHRGLDGLRDEERFGGWVYRIARNVIVDAARARAREPLLQVAEVLDDTTDSESGGQDAGLQADLGECIALFVARLPSPYREAITLTELRGLTQKEAAEMIGISVSGMKSRVQRGRERVRDLFEQCCKISVDCRGRVTECAPRNLEDVRPDCHDAARAWSDRSPPK